MRYLNSRLSYYNFRFLKTDVCHIGILLPVSIFSFSSLSPIGISFCIGEPNFITSRLTHGGVMTSCRFFKMAAIVGIGFNNGTVEMLKSICTPNFDETHVYRSTAELLLLPISENGRPQYSTSGCHFDLCILMGMAFCYQIDIAISANPAPFTTLNLETRPRL